MDDFFVGAAAGAALAPASDGVTLKRLNMVVNLVSPLLQAVAPDFFTTVLEGTSAGKALLNGGARALDQAASRLVPALRDKLTQAIDSYASSVYSLSPEQADVLRDDLQKLFANQHLSPALLADQNKEQLIRVLCHRYDEQHPLTPWERAHDAEAVRLAQQAHAAIAAIVPVFAEVYQNREAYLKHAVTDIAAGVEATLGTTQRIEDNTEQLKAAVAQLQAMLNERAQKPGPSVAALTLKAAWDKPLFLEDPKRPEQQRALLASVYLMPHYLEGDEPKPRTDLEELLKNQLAKSIRALLILGQPGIGKSTLITWYLNHVSERRAVVYCFRDLASRPWQDATQGNCLTLLCQNMEGETKTTLQNTVLFLDGFDEIELDSNSRRKYLTMLCKAASTIQNLTLVITCREHFITKDDLKKLPQELKRLTLQPWDEAQIKQYVARYNAATQQALTPSPLTKKTREVLGIPLIQYMVLALNIRLKKSESSIAAVYDRIFTLKENEEGIYDRCIQGVQYNELSGSPESIRLLKQQVHQLSCDIAQWMLEHGTTNLPIGPNKLYDSSYEDLLHRAAQRAKATEELLGTALQTEGFWQILDSSLKDTHSTEGLHEGSSARTLHFVHRSMYQYFAAEGFFQRLQRYGEDFTVEGLQPARLAAAFAAHFSGGRIDTAADKDDPDTTVRAYLASGLRRRYPLERPAVREELYRAWESAGEQLIRSGSAFCAGQAAQRKGGKAPAPDAQPEGGFVPYLNSYALYRAEADCIGNLCSALRLVRKLCQRPAEERIFAAQNPSKNPKKGTAADRWQKALASALRHCRAEGVVLDLSHFALQGLDLNHVDLRDCNLSGADLSGAGLIDADLSGADLSGAVLFGSALSRADLSGAVLFGANLSGADLPGAKLSGTKLSSAVLSGAKLAGADLARVNLSFANLSHADMARAVLSYADLSGADLSLADLSLAVLSGAVLSGAVLSRADLSGVALFGADLSGARLTSTDFYGRPLRDLGAERFSAAEFTTLFVDGQEYTREEFFDKFF